MLLLRYSQSFQVFWAFYWHQLLKFAILAPTAISHKVLASCGLSVNILFLLHQFRQHLSTSSPGCRDCLDSRAALHKLSLVHLSRHWFGPFLIYGPERLQDALIVCWTRGLFREFVMDWEARRQPHCSGIAPNIYLDVSIIYPYPCDPSPFPPRGEGRKIKYALVSV